MAYKAVSETRIYLDLRRLLDKVLDIVPNFPKAYKYTVGDKLQRLSIDLVRDISVVYLNRDKTERMKALCRFQANFETFKLLVRVAGERRWIAGRNAHAELIELAVNIGRQSSAWMRTLSGEGSPASRNHKVKAE